MTLFKSNKLAAIAVSDDGRNMTLAFETGKGKRVDLEIPTVQMRPIIQNIMGALLSAEAISSLAHQGIVSVISPSQTKVSRSDDSENVLVAFRLPSEMEYKFALPSSDALRLGQQIVEVAQKNSRASQSRPH